MIVNEDAFFIFHSKINNNISFRFHLISHYFTRNDTAKLTLKVKIIFNEN